MLHCLLQNKKNPGGWLYTDTGLTLFFLVVLLWVKCAIVKCFNILCCVCTFVWDHDRHCPCSSFSRSRWVELLDVVHCQIISTCSNGCMDAYLLRWVSVGERKEVLVFAWVASSYSGQKHPTTTPCLNMCGIFGNMTFVRIILLSICASGG